MRLSTSQGFNTPLLYTVRMAARSVGAMTSNSFINSISLIHTLAASDGTAILPYSCHFNVTESQVQLVTESRQIVTQLLRGYLCVNLCGLDICVSQNTAHAFNRHAFAEG